MKHCMYCGGSVNQNKNKYTCKDCDKTYYDNPKAAVVVMLFTSNKQQIVLARRAHEPAMGKLDFIGGFLDVGETFEQAAYREMYEESGLSRDDIGKFIYVTSIYNGYMWEGIEIPTTSVCYLAEIKNTKNLLAADDVGSFEYFDIDKLPSSDDCAWLDMPRVLTDTIQLLAEM